MAERLLAIDYGKKYIGFAVADYPGITARALATIRQDRQNPLAVIAQIIAQEKVTKFILGFPYSDIEGEIHQNIKAFANLLRQNFPTVPVELVDESFSSLEADSLLRETGLGRKAARRVQDSQAAKLILLRYLEKCR